MKKFDVEIKRSANRGEPLPAGGYVARITDAQVAKYDWGEVLVISFDIAEGEYKGFFSTQYRENTNEDKKWKGNFRLNVPQESNQYFDSQKRTFGNCIACLEESNIGWKWGWNEAELKGKMVGVLFRNYEYKINGNTGWSTECCTFLSVDDVRSKKFKKARDKHLKKPANTNSGFVDIGDDFLPFY